jgi:hypothetical protein
MNTVLSILCFIFNYHVVNDDRRGQLGALSSVSSSLMMIITTIYVPIYSVLITAALLLHLDDTVGRNLQTYVEAPRSVLFCISVKQRDCNGLELVLELVNFISLFSCARYWAEGVRDIRAGRRVFGPGVGGRGACKKRL